MPAKPSISYRRAAFVVALAGAAVVLLDLFVEWLPASLSPLGAQTVLLVEWIVFISAANLVTIPVLPRANLDVGLGGPVIVASAVSMAPPMAVAANLLALVSGRELQADTAVGKVVFNRTQMALSAGAAAVTAHGLAGVEALMSLGRVGGIPAELVIRTLAAVLVYNVVNIAAISGVLYLRARTDRRLGNAVRVGANPIPSFAVNFALVTLLALLVIVAYRSAGWPAMVLLALPLYLGYSSLRSARVAEDRAEELVTQVHELAALNALGSTLVSVRRPEEVVQTGVAALGDICEAATVEVSLTGSVDEGLQVVKIPGAEPAAVGVPADLDPRLLEVVETVGGLLGMALQRLELESEVAEGQRARVALSGQILEEGTRERNRIALEIHDEVLPFLAAAEIQADNVRSALSHDDPKRASDLAAAARDAVQRGTGRLRDVLEALRRQIVVPGGLRSALTAALEELRLTAGVKSSLQTPQPLPALPLAVEIIVLEVARGCLTNVARHAAAEHVTVSLRVDQGLLAVTVRDDGRGFDPRSMTGRRHGLALMRQRIELARGSFNVTSAPGAGTQVDVEVPL